MKTHALSFWPLVFVAVSTLGCGIEASPAQAAGSGGTGGQDETGGNRGNADSSAGVGGALAGGGDDAEAGNDAEGDHDAKPEASGAGGSMDVTPRDDAGDAPSEGGSIACAGLLCEDFERGQIDPAKWEIQTKGGHTVTVQQDTVAHGKHAARFHAPGGAVGYDFILTKNAASELRGHHYGRAYFLVTPTPPTGHTGLMFAGTSGFPMFKYLEVAAIRGGWQLTFVQLVGSPKGETYLHVDLAQQMPLKVWTCIEWEFNDEPDQIVLTVDGKPTGSADPILYNGKTSGLVGGFTDFGFGFYDWHPDDFAFDIYYDDIVLDTKRVGCLGAGVP